MNLENRRATLFIKIPVLSMLSHCFHRTSKEVNKIFISIFLRNIHKPHDESSNLTKSAHSKPMKFINPYAPDRIWYNVNFWTEYNLFGFRMFLRQVKLPYICIVLTYSSSSLAILQSQFDKVLLWTQELLC